MVLDQIPFELESAELFKRLRMDPEGEYARDLLDLARAVAAVARPRALYREAFIEERGDDTVRVGDVTFTSRALRGNLADVHRVFAYVATCGPEMDAVPVPADDLFGGYCRDTVKEMVRRAALDHLHGHLRETYSLGRFAAMHPGAGDAGVWAIQDQRQLFALLGDVEGLVGVRLTESCLMQPNKSVTGLLYATTVDFVTCQLCHREKCPSRRAPFDQVLWQARMDRAA
ncbi:MAG: hypothetical protein HYU66_15075 [Armatimonadetes bacterium]|nr:hypothetical protein [Armatimonadota bacterium]